MAFRNISVVLTANVTSFRAQMGAAAAATRDFGKEAVQVAQRADAESRRTLNTMGRVAVATSAAVAAGFGLAAKEAIGFERSMRNVNSISGMSERQLTATSDAVIELSRRLPQGATLLAEGLYDIASSGFQGAEGLQVLEASATAASAGLTTTATSSRAIAAVLNAYGLQAADAGRVSDVLFQVVNKGVVSFEELAGVVGDFVGTAAAAGVPIEEAGAALATMTINGLGASEAGTSLNRVLQSLIDPSAEMSKTLQDLGFQSGVAALDALGLEGVMEQLRVATGGQIEALVKLFPEIRAARGALALMSAEGSNYSKIAGDFTDKSKIAGITQQVLAEQSKSAAFQLGVAGSSLQGVGITIGQTALPLIRGAATGVQDLSNGLADLPGPARSAAIGVGGVLTTVSGVGGAFVLLAPRIQSAKKLFSDLSETAPRLASALRLSAVGLGVLGAALALGAVALVAYEERKREARRTTEGFTQALHDEREGVEGATRAHVVDELQRRKLLGTIREMGVDIGSVVDGVLGEQKAVEDLGRSLVKNLPAGAQTIANQRLLVDALNGSDSALRDLKGQFLDSKFASDQNLQSTIALVTQLGLLSDGSTDAVTAQRALDGAQKDAGDSASDTRAQLARLGDEAATSATKTQDLTDAQKDLQRALAGFVEPSGVYTSLLQKRNDEQRRQFDKERDERIRAQDEQLTGDRQTLERRQELEERALDDRLRAERDALDSKAEITDDARRIERDALDATTVDQRRALEDKHAAEREAFDAQQEETKRGRDDWATFTESAKVSLKEYADALDEQVRNQENWERNLVTVAGRAGSDVALLLADMGKDGVELTAAMANGTEAEVKRMADSLRREAALGGEGARQEIESGMLILEQLAATGATKIVEAIRSRLANGTTTIGDVVKQYGYVLEQGVTTMIGQIDRLNQAFVDLGSNLEALPNGQVIGPGGQVIVQLSPEGSFAEGGITSRSGLGAGVFSTPTVLVGEGRGSESYIPHHESYRSTAVPVLHQTAARLGYRAVPMANGGFIGPAHPVTAPAGGGAAPAAGAVPAFHVGQLTVEGARDPERDGRSITRVLKAQAFLMTGVP